MKNIYIYRLCKGPGISPVMGGPGAALLPKLQGPAEGILLRKGQVRC